LIQKANPRNRNRICHRIKLKTYLPTPGGIERRKHTRHRFIVDLNISSENGTSMHGMSFEIGAGGMSAATAGRLEVGEQVFLYSVIRARVNATVRRKNGSMYGFEFLAPTSEFQEKIVALCQTSPLFQTVADI
jgi:c-di-GMP-binding flagellar brake protein YcgR